jgi:1-acyl-sn-glycerol-3-phosphate acyltransferase
MRPVGNHDGPFSRPESRPAIRILQAVNVCFSRIYHRVGLLSPCRLPRHGPAILVCNHTSGLDPLLIQAFCPRLIVWMIAKEFYDIKVLNSIFRTIESIPVTRSGKDLTATRAALRALDRGRVLGVFPEGKIAPTPDLLPFQTGVAMMAMKTQVPVFPAYLEGTQRGKEIVPALLIRNRAVLAFGPPVELANGMSLQAATGAIETAVAKLKAGSYGSRDAGPLATAPTPTGYPEH